MQYEKSDVIATTLIGMRLSLLTEREKAIREIVEKYRETKSLPRVAEHFQITLRTLSNYRQKVPELQRAIEKVREELFAER